MEEQRGTRQDEHTTMDFQKAGCGDVGWIHMAPDKLHGVSTVHDRALQLSFPPISSVSRAAKLNPKLYIGEITKVSMPPLPPSPLTKKKKKKF